MTEEEKMQIKRSNEQLIAQKGYRINDWLPILDTPHLRSIEDIKNRMSVMNAIINIAFEAPTYIIRQWIENENLSRFLSEVEKKILGKENNELTQQETNSLFWYLESLWSFMWVTKMIDALDAEKPVANQMASMLPNLERVENNEKLKNINSIRSITEIYTMLDYYYRLHWYCVDERLHGKNTKLNEGQIYERRRALEWTFNRIADWDNVEMGT